MILQYLENRAVREPCKQRISVYDCYFFADILRRPQKFGPSSTFQKRQIIGGRWGKLSVAFSDYQNFKVHIFWEGHKISRNLQCRFDRYYIGQIYCGDFAKFCDLLRLSELYTHGKSHPKNDRRSDSTPRIPTLPV